MTPTLTIAVMLVVTLGAAVYVAWPLLFGRVNPEDFLAVEGVEPRAQARAGKATMTRLGDESYEAAQGAVRRRAAASGSRVDLDVEQEIEAFRRKTKETGPRATLNCASCGRPVKDPDAAFCSKCGAPISKGAGQNRKSTGNSREEA